MPATPPVTPSITAAEVIRGQLLDVLIDVPLSALRNVDRITLMDLFDWVDRVKEAAPRMALIPTIPKLIRGWCNDRQLTRDWQSFTTWRPAEPLKQQRGLFE